MTAAFLFGDYREPFSVSAIFCRALVTVCSSGIITYSGCAPILYVVLVAPVPSTLIDSTLQRLSNNAGSPLLDIDQPIIISQASIAELVNTTTDASPAPKKDTNEAQKTTTTDKPTSASYSFTAAAGDSYTTLARSAISNYLSATGTTLTGVQRVAAESQLVATAAASDLSIGQVVAFDPQTIKRAVATATSLSDAELSAWQPYATLAGL